MASDPNTVWELASGEDAATECSQGAQVMTRAAWTRAQKRASANWPAIHKHQTMKHAEKRMRRDARRMLDQMSMEIPVELQPRAPTAPRPQAKAPAGRRPPPPPPPPPPVAATVAHDVALEQKEPTPPWRAEAEMEKIHRVLMGIAP